MYGIFFFARAVRVGCIFYVTYTLKLRDSIGGRAPLMKEVWRFGFVISKQMGANMWVCSHTVSHAHIASLIPTLVYMFSVPFHFRV